MEAHTHSKCQQPAHSACMQKTGEVGGDKTKKLAIHTLGTGMTSTWSHYITRKRDKHTQRVRGKDSEDGRASGKDERYWGRLQRTLGGDPFSSTGGGRELVLELELTEGGSTL